VAFRAIADRVELDGDGVRTLTRTFTVVIDDSWSLFAS
jgi:hypothetical protein